MFIQSQQSVTNSSSSSSTNGAVQPKKRKAEHYNSTGIGNGNSASGGGTELSFLEQVFCVNGSNNQNFGSATISTQTTNNHQNSNHASNSPSHGTNQQPFVRASTIKLLDTYQRCGQKVSFWMFWNVYTDLPKAIDRRFDKQVARILWINNIRMINILMYIV